MLKSMDDLEQGEDWTEVYVEEVDENVYEVENEEGKKRRVYFEADDDVFTYGEMDGLTYHDDLDDMEGILPDLDRKIEHAQIALEQVGERRARALDEDHLALYLALDVKAAEVRGYFQGLTAVRERVGGDAPRPLLNDEPLGLTDEREAQAKLDVLVRRIEKLLARRPEQGGTN